MKPQATRHGWVFTEKGGGSDTLGGLGLLLVAAMLLVAVGWGVLELLNVSTRSDRPLALLALAVLGALAGLCFVGAIKLRHIDDWWHPATLTVPDWPIRIGHPITATYEQRRRQVLAPAPELQGTLLLQHRDESQQGHNRLTTVERVPVSINQRDTEPLRATIELTVPESWIWHLDEPGYQFTLQLQRFVDEGSIGFIIPLELVE